MNLMDMIHNSIATHLRRQGVHVHSIKDITEHATNLGVETAVIHRREEGGPLHTTIIRQPLIEILQG